jgi:hypothetical protein
MKRFPCSMHEFHPIVKNINVREYRRGNGISDNNTIISWFTYSKTFVYLFVIFDVYAIVALQNKYRRT